MFNLKHFAIAGLIALFVLYVPQAIAMDPPSYNSIDFSHKSHDPGLVEICEIIQGLNYDKTQIDWYRQYNGTSDYWCCSHKILTNEGGKSNDKSDDYHLCHVYSGGATAAINAFGINLPLEVLEITGEELYVISGIAGSSFGVNPSTNFSNKIYNSSGSIVASAESRLTILLNNFSEEGRNSQFNRQYGQGSQRERFFNIVVTLSQLP